MKLDKKDLPKLAALGVLVVICIGVVSFQLLGGSGNAPPPAPAAGNTAKTGTSATGAATASGSATAATPSGTPSGTSAGAPIVPAGSFPGVNSNLPRRDPFLPQQLAEDVKPESARTQKPAPRRAPTPNLSIPSGRVPPLNPLAGGVPAGLAAVPTPEEKAPDFVLTGVIRGAHNVAIIRAGQGGRYIVQQGQIIDGRYKVLSVSDDTAVLADKNRRISVKLGGNKNGS